MINLQFDKDERVIKYLCNLLSYASNTQDLEFRDVQNCYNDQFSSVIDGIMQRLSSEPKLLPLGSLLNKCLETIPPQIKEKFGTLRFSLKYVCSVNKHFFNESTQYCFYYTEAQNTSREFPIDLPLGHRICGGPDRSSYVLQDFPKLYYVEFMHTLLEKNNIKEDRTKKLL